MSRFGAVLLALALTSGCNCGKPAVSPNEPPVATISAPAESSSFRAGTQVSLVAVANDPEDGPLDGDAVVWTSSLSGQLATGASASAALSKGTQSLTVTATDKGGLTASASVTVNAIDANAPTVVIVKPAAGTSVDLNQQVDFWCDATTVQGQPVPDTSIQWSSALSGPLPFGSKMKAALSKSGADTITCSATDPASGASNSASVSITVTGVKAPSVQITRPLRAEVWVSPAAAPPFSSTVSFVATAQDFNAGGGAGNLDSAIQWVRDPGGVAIGSGPSATHTFPSLGDYTVTAQAIDSRGVAASDSVRVHVVSNLPPYCEITRPGQDGQVIQVNAPYNVRGSCFDPESNTPIPPEWRTSVQATPLGTGANLSVTFTALGNQVLSACATDPQDAQLQGCFSRPIRVIANTPPSACTILAPATGATVNAGVPVPLKGSATDAEDPASSLDFRWSSNLDGNLAAGADTTTVDLTTPGPHTLTLTVSDPWGASCRASIAITVNGSPAVAIVAVTQGATNCLAGPCAAGQPTNATATATDPQGIASQQWTDSFEGSLGTAVTATLSAPAAGKHALLFAATDTLGAVGRAQAQITLLPSGRTQLADTLLDNGQPVEDLVQGLATGELLYVDGNTKSVLLLRDPGGPGTPQAISEAGLGLFMLGGTVFVGTDGNGLEKCVGAVCVNYKNGPLAPAGSVVNDVVASQSPDLLLLCTDDGLVITKASDPALSGSLGTVQGKRLLDGRKVREAVLSPTSTATAVKAFAATDDGLAELDIAVGTPFDPLTSQVTVTTHQPPRIRDSDVFSVAVSPEGKAFAGTRRGFSDLTGDGPRLREPPYSFPDEEIRALLFERRTIAGSARDLLWAGTRNGLVRYDLGTKVPSRLTHTDGLPPTGGPAEIRSLALGPGGVKYIGTAVGIAKYDGN
ncbi:MAG: hypothetical protein HYZ28_24360 [Myxococcales bacterium]|nr:hypothetical protein [Myxococcales bacterium]